MNWFDAIRKAGLKEPDKIPKGWESMESLADKNKCSKQTVVRVTALGVSKGAVEKKKFSVKTVSGRIRAIWFFKPIR